MSKQYEKVMKPLLKLYILTKEEYKSCRSDILFPPLKKGEEDVNEQNIIKLKIIIINR